MYTQHHSEMVVFPYTPMYDHESDNNSVSSVSSVSSVVFLLRTADDVGFDSKVLCDEHDIGSCDLDGRCVAPSCKLLSKIRIARGGRWPRMSNT